MLCCPYQIWKTKIPSHVSLSILFSDILEPFCVNKRYHNIQFCPYHIWYTMRRTIIYILTHLLSFAQFLIAEFKTIWIYTKLCRRTWSVPVDCILHTSETPSLLETDVWRHSVHKLWTWRQMPIHKIIFAKSEKNIKENVYFYMVRLNFAILNKLNCDELQTIFIIPSIASFFGM